MSIHNQQNTQEALKSSQSEIDRLNKELALARQRYLDLFETAGDSIFIIDATNYTILDANKHASRRLGYTHDELIGMSLEALEVVDVDDDNAMQVAWVSSVSGTRIFEGYYRHKAGHLIPVEVSSRYIETGDQAIFQNFVREISIRKEIEAEREALLTDLDNFAHMVAHDLKSPISNVISAVELMQMMMPEVISDDVLECMKVITSNSHATNNIIHALLTFASVRNQEHISFAALDMAAIVNSILKRHASAITHHQAEIIVPESWPLALGYAPWVAEIWTNYISNAIKYGGDPPRIELGAEPEQDGMICFWVRDNGRGIAPDQLEAVFEKFNRLGEMHIEGNGLGLSIVKRIVERLQGKVSAESTLDEGSTFSFTLPAVHLNP